jgi:hypothetical protein
MIELESHLIKTAIEYGMLPVERTYMEHITHLNS